MKYSNFQATRHPYYFIFFILTSILMASCGTSRNVASNTNHNTEMQQRVVDYGKRYMHTPYRYGSNGPRTFDCSGFTSFVFKQFGYRLHRSSVGQDRQSVTIRAKEKLQTADLVFFEGRNRNGKVGHVGIVTETFPNGTFKFIHASTSRGVIISSSTEPYYAARYLRGGQILPHYKKPKEATHNGRSADYQTKDKRYNAFIPAKAKVKKSAIGITETNQDKSSGAETLNDKESIVIQQIEACDSLLSQPHIQTSTDTLHLQQKNTYEELSDETTDTSSQKEKKEVADAVIKAMTWQDSISVPKPVVKKINQDTLSTQTDENTKQQPTRRYIVKPGDTLYSLSRFFDCTIDDLIRWNPQLKEGLKTGDKIDICKRGLSTP